MSTAHVHRMFGKFSTLLRENDQKKREKIDFRRRRRRHRRRREPCDIVLHIEYPFISFIAQMKSEWLIAEYIYGGI